MLPIAVGSNLIKPVHFAAKDSTGDQKSDVTPSDVTPKDSVNLSDNPLDKVNRAAQQKLKAVQRAAEEKRLKEQTAFLNKTFATVNGEPFSGLDLLKVIDAAIQKRFLKRDWSRIALMTAFTLGTAGTLMADKSFRKEWGYSLSSGLPEDEFKKLLEGFELPEGRSAHYQSVYFELVGLGLIENGTGYRVVLTAEAKKVLNPKLK